MKIESNYLVVYEKKGKQRVLVLGREALLKWQRKNKDKDYRTFSLEQCSISEIY